VLTADKLIGLMAEPERRRVIAALITSPGDLSDIVDRTGLSAREVVDVLERLHGAGLTEQGSDGTVILIEELFKVAARSSASTATASGAAQMEQNAATEAEQVLAASIVDGTLVHLPRKRSKRLIVLDRLAQEFEPGRHYSEREVNQLLRPFDGDVAALRRYLVDERFLDRGDGTYWRSGGTVDSADTERNHGVGQDGCEACGLADGSIDLPGGLIHETAHWLVEHCVGPLGLATLIVKPKRHVTAVGDLRAEESAELGPLLQQASDVASQLVAADQVYNCLWSHSDRTPGHIHYVVQPVTAAQMAAHDAHGPLLQTAMFMAGEQPTSGEVEVLAETARGLFSELR
jgi:diadenosine tetraphosphate (Ap4A) HIT family hydrolase